MVFSSNRLASRRGAGDDKLKLLHEGSQEAFQYLSRACYSPAVQVVILHPLDDIM